MKAVVVRDFPSLSHTDLILTYYFDGGHLLNYATLFLVLL